MNYVEFIRLQLRLWAESLQRHSSEFLPNIVDFFGPHLPYAGPSYRVLVRVMGFRNSKPLVLEKESI